MDYGKENDERRFHSVGFYVSPDDIEKFTSALQCSGVSGKFLSKILLLSERITGLKTVLEIPELLVSQKPELWKYISTLRTLRELNYCSGWSTDVFHYPDVPELYITIIHTTTKKKTQRSFGADGIGCSLFSQEETFPAAIGEAVERWSFVNFEPHSRDMTRASYETMQQKKMPVLDIFTLSGIDPGTRKAPPLGLRLYFDKTTPFEWIKGRSLTSQKPIFIPAQLIGAYADSLHNKGEPILRMAISNGMASHETLPKAIFSGVLELIERDAFMITWLNKISPSRIASESIADVRIQNILNSFKRYNLETHFLYLPTDMPVHVVLAAVVDKSGVAPALSIGASAQLSTENALKKSLTEALAVHKLTRASLTKARAEKRDISYPDKNTVGHAERLLYWSNGDKIKDAAFLFEGKKISVQDLPSYTFEKGDQDNLNVLTGAFREKGLELSYIDVSEEKIRKAFGFRTVMVVAPELQPLHLAEFLPYTWGKRLKTVPLQHNIQPAKKVYGEPHPFP